LKFGTVAAWRPTMPKRLGPILFLPASAVWQSAHFLKTDLPASTSPSAKAGDTSARVAPTRITPLIFIFLSPGNGTAASLYHSLIGGRRPLAVRPRVNEIGQAPRFDTLRRRHAT
jgi:hypothetical protein